MNSKHLHRIYEIVFVIATIILLIIGYQFFIKKDSTLKKVVVPLTNTGTNSRIEQSNLHTETGDAYIDADEDTNICSISNIQDETYQPNVYVAEGDSFSEYIDYSSGLILRAEKSYEYTSNGGHLNLSFSNKNDNFYSRLEQFKIAKECLEYLRPFDKLEASKYIYNKLATSVGAKQIKHNIATNLADQIEYYYKNKVDQYEPKIRGQIIRNDSDVTFFIDIFKFKTNTEDITGVNGIYIKNGYVGAVSFMYPSKHLQINHEPNDLAFISKILSSLSLDKPESYSLIPVTQ